MILDKKFYYKMESQIEVLKEKVLTHKTHIDDLRSHCHNMTNSFVAMNKTLEYVNKDLESLFVSTIKLSEKIDTFNFSIMDKIQKIDMVVHDDKVKKEYVTKLIKSSPILIKYVFLSAIFIGLIAKGGSINEIIKRFS